MIQYYLFMGLLITTLVLWGIVALREERAAPDEPEESTEERPES